MARRIGTKSRSVTYNTDQGELDYPFTFGLADSSDIFVYQDGRELQEPEYDVVDGEIVRLTNAAPLDSTIEIVRVTAPSNPITVTEITYLIEEAIDALVFQDGHGRALLTFPAGSESSLFTNELDTSDPLNPKFIFPVIQMLPDGGLAPDLDGLNPGGFHLAAWRFQHRIPASVQAQSMTAGGWFSLVLEKPDDEVLDSKKTCYGFRFLFKGYQNGFQNGLEEYEFEHGAINPVAETGAGATRGSAQAIIAEARHEAAQATRIIGTDDSAITFTAQGTEAGRGEAGNDIRIKIVVTTLEGITVQGKDITILTGATNQHADELADMVNAHPQASELVIAVAAGSGLVSSTGDFIALEGGMNTDGKLVGAQIVLTPRGKDPGPGYANNKGGIALSDGSFESYGYTANTNGFHTGFAAIIAKGKADPGEAHIEGWYNGFVAHYKTRSRLLWMPLHCAIEVPGFYVDKGTEENPDIRAHNSMWMGIGTDEPEGTLHVKTAVDESPETPEIILDNANPLVDLHLTVARVVMKGVNGELVALTGAITDSVGGEDAKLTLSVAENGAPTPRWNFAGGLWSEGVTGGDKGAGAINVGGVHVEGAPALRKVAGGGLALNFGAAEARTISGDAITFAGSSMLISAEGGAADDLTTINGGTTGDALIIRKAPDGHTVTVKQSASIKCGANRALGNNASLLLTCISPGVWSAEG